MISQLNSILLEGVVTNKKVATKKHRKVVVYTIKNTSREATNNKIQELSIGAGGKVTARDIRGHDDTSPRKACNG